MAIPGDKERDREREGVTKEHICVPLLCALLVEVESWPLEIGPPLITQRDFHQELYAAGSDLELTPAVPCP
jgi:hypothetical protein